MINKATTTSYVWGFALSLLLTLAAYFIVVNHLLSGGMLIASVTALGLVQLVVQLVFFLHIWQESQPRWNLAIFLSTVSIILIIVIGSLWIINNLNYNHMTSPEETEKAILHDEGIHR